MHQNSPFWDPQWKIFWGGDTAPPQTPPPMGRGNPLPTPHHLGALDSHAFGVRPPRSMVAPMLNRNWRPCILVHIADICYNLKVCHWLQLENVAKDRLRLVAVTCLLIAAKYEEKIYSTPEVDDLVFITNDTYTNLEIRQMEWRILKALDFKLGRPLPVHFLRRYVKAGDVRMT